MHIDGRVFDRQAARRIAANIRRRRKQELKLTQEQLAEAGGYEPGYISEVERAVKRPSLDFLFRIARAMDISVADLLEGVDEAPSRAFQRSRLQERIQRRLDELRNLLEEFVRSG